MNNEMFHMPVEQARIPRKVKDYTLAPKEYDAAVRGEEVPIRFKSDNGKFYATSIQMSAAERGVEFLLSLIHISQLEISFPGKWSEKQRKTFLKGLGKCSNSANPLI